MFYNLKCEDIQNRTNVSETLNLILKYRY